MSRQNSQACRKVHVKVPKYHIDNGWAGMSIFTYIRKVDGAGASGGMLSVH